MPHLFFLAIPLTPSFSFFFFPYDDRVANGPVPHASKVTHMGSEVKAKFVKLQYFICIIPK